MEEIQPQPLKKTGKPGRKFGLTGRQPAFMVVDDYKENPGNHHEDDIINTEDHYGMSSSDSESTLSEQEIEDRYNTISLSIRTEGLTLRHRLEHQHRQRDLVEGNLKKETDQLYAVLQAVKQEVATGISVHNGRNCESSHFHDLFVKVENQIQALYSSALRVSSAAETLGAVEHEARLSAAVDLLILYVDNLKRKWEKEHRELEETKRLLKESGVNVEECLAALPDKQQLAPNNLLNVPKGVQLTRRRASFPASPIRRISFTSPSCLVSQQDLPASQPAPLLAIEGITEEKDEEDIDQVFMENEISQQDVLPDTTVQDQMDSNGCDKATVIEKGEQDHRNVSHRKSRVGKSKSWKITGGVGKSAVLRDKQEKLNTMTMVIFFIIAWTRTTGQWCQMNYDKLKRKCSQWRKHCRHFLHRHWKAKNALLLTRYAAVACFLLAALLSLFFTFVPSINLSSVIWLQSIHAAT